MGPDQGGAWLEWVPSSMEVGVNRTATQTAQRQNCHQSYDLFFQNLGFGILWV